LQSAPLHAVLTDTSRSPEAELDRCGRAELATAAYAARHGSQVYQSLKNLTEVIGTQYGDRVLYELIQNAHDAHTADDHGRILVRLVVKSPTEGCLYVANGGAGFRREDVDAIRNLAISGKEIGEGIGNKGLGFRSIEALTDDVQIYSQPGRTRAERFSGYCFRFANVDEIANLLIADDVAVPIAKQVATSIPRYLVPRPLFRHEQPDEVTALARAGYATVITLPLRHAEAVGLATEQVRLLADLEVPLLLFLARIEQVQLEIHLPNRRPIRRYLRRNQTPIAATPPRLQYVRSRRGRGSAISHHAPSARPRSGSGCSP